MSDNIAGPFYIIITHSDGLQVVDQRNVSANPKGPDDWAHYHGTRLIYTFWSIKEAEAMINEITLSVLRSELVQLNRRALSEGGWKGGWKGGVNEGF